MRYPAWCVLMLLACAPAFAALEGVNHAEICGRCHRDILSAWKQSAHAHAMEDPIFQDALERAEEIDPGARPICLGCHAPTVKYSGDLSLKTKASWEGVTCDFCHSVKSVEVTRKYGDDERALRRNEDRASQGRLFERPRHGVFLRSYHVAHLCGVPRIPQRTRVRRVDDLLGVGRESLWRRRQKLPGLPHGGNLGPGRGPQDQALAAVHGQPARHAGQPLDRDAQQGRDLTDCVRGGRGTSWSPKWISRIAARVIASRPVRRCGASSWRSKSRWAASNCASSAPSSGGSLTQKAKKLHARSLVFLRAARELSDNRLKPGEKHQEIFRFPLRASESARIYARLWYRYSPQERSAEAQRVEFLVFPQFLPAK